MSSPGPGARPAPGPAPLRVVDLTAAFASFDDHWSPRVVGALNGQEVKVAKLQGPFVWHHHREEDELFLVVAGTLRMELRDSPAVDVERDPPHRQLVVAPGQFLIVPRGVEHRPVADEEVHLVLFEPADTLNTGNIRNQRTVERPGTLG
jgi:mannose-6-phosphate isomerase-like protein (cupin superfamily)